MRKAMAWMPAAMCLAGCATNQPLPGLQSIMADADRLDPSDADVPVAAFSVTAQTGTWERDRS